MVWRECIKEIATLISVVIALITLVKGFFEYVKQGTQKRAEHFLQMRKRFKENEIFRELASLIESKSPKLKKESFKNKRDYLGFFEEIALMINSGLINDQVAHYMFGYYAIQCWHSDYFWGDVNRDSLYWALFKDFVLKMERIESSFVYEEKKLHF